MTEERRAAVSAAEEKIRELMGRLLHMKREGFSYDLRYDGDTGWIGIIKWDLTGPYERSVEERFWRSDYPNGVRLFNLRYHSLDELIAWLDAEAREGVKQSC